MEELYGPIDENLVSAKFNLKDTFVLYEEMAHSFMTGVAPKEEKNSKYPSDELEKVCEPLKYFSKYEALYDIQENTDETIMPITDEGKSKLATLRALHNSQFIEGNNDSKEDTKANKSRTTYCLKIEPPQVGRFSHADLSAFHHLLLTIKVYQSCLQQYGAKRKADPMLTQTITVIAENTLTEFRDAIFCDADYRVPEESENLDEDATRCNKEIYPSGCFFIEKVFYNDMRNAESKDYSQVIVKWLKNLPVKINNVRTASMEGVKFEDLSLRLGYPYMYLHQGHCEHLIVFADARLISPSDSLFSSKYPQTKRVIRKSSNLCKFCGDFIASWKVCEYNKLPYDPAYLCKRCVAMYCFKDGKKAGTFRLYKYIDPSTVMATLK